MADENRARWIKLVADFESCDLSQREFADERGLSLSNLRYWLYPEPSPHMSAKTSRKTRCSRRSSPNLAMRGCSMSSFILGRAP